MGTPIDAEVERYMAKPYRVEMMRSDWGWYVKIPDLPGCMSQGETPQEALEMIQEAQRLWIQTALEDGQLIPEPRSDEGAEYSGRLLVRMPKDMHRDLLCAAEAQGVSLNLYVVAALARSLGRPEPETRKPGRPRKDAAVAR